MIRIDPSLPVDVQVLIKSAYHLSNKAEPIYNRDGLKTGYRTPVREMDRVRSKVGYLVQEVD